MLDLYQISIRCDPNAFTMLLPKLRALECPPRIYRSPFISAAAPLTIFRSSYSFVNSLLRISKFPTNSLQQFTKASFGLTSPSVWIRSSIVAKRGWGTSSYELESASTTPTLTLVPCEDNMVVFEEVRT
jgi:hypothetical protein